MLIVVAIGDSLVQDAPTLRELRAEAALVGSRLAAVAATHDLVITLGSGLQHAALEWQAAESNDVRVSPPTALTGLPRDLLLGHLLRQELANALPADKRIVSILTTTEVDPRDPAFDEPTATVGPTFNEQEAAQVSEQQEWALRPHGPAWRRAVPQPEPRRILETQPIEWLLSQGCVVICTAGGPPVMYLPGTRTLATAEVVCDPIHVTSVVAIDIDADRLVITTLREGNRPAIPAADPHRRTFHPDDIASGRLRGESLPAELRAADEFTRTTGHTTLLGQLAELPDLLAGTSGTQISLSAEPRENQGGNATVSPLNRGRRT